MIKTSPIFYMGSKRKLISKGLTDYFPKNIKRFYDLFSGGLSVTLNTKAEKYIINDINGFLFTLYAMFKDNSAEDIISKVKHYIDLYDLPKERTKRNEYKNAGKIEEYKENYKKARDYFNKTRDTFGFYCLTFFSFSQQFRFNKEGDYNMPFGNDCFSALNELYIKELCDFMQNNKVAIHNKSYEHFIGEPLDKDDFVYLDPPYSITTAVYNESNRQDSGWGYKEDSKLFWFLDSLTSMGIKWGLSNVFHCKNKSNEPLINWVNRNKYNVIHFTNFSYNACGKGNSNADEVFIYNYDINPIDKGLFSL